MNTNHAIAPVYIITLQDIVWLVEGIKKYDLMHMSGWPVNNCSVECYFERDGTWTTDKALIQKADGIFYTKMAQVPVFYDPRKVNLIFASESFVAYPGKETVNNST